MESIIGVLGTILIFGAIIFFHEFGHFIVAKLSGMGVLEFSLGFGPAIAKRTIGDTLYAIRILPLGGFVRVAGMALDDEEEDPPNGFNRKPFPARFGVILAGAFMNFVLAFLILIVIGTAVGYPKPGNKVFVGGVQPYSPAEKAGLISGDVFVEIANQPVAPDGEQGVRQIRDAIQHVTPPIPIVIDRNGVRKTVRVTPTQMMTAERNGLLYTMKPYKGIGIQMSTTSGEWERTGFGESVIVGTTGVANQIVDALAQVVSLVSGRIPPNQMSGPPGIMNMSYHASKNALVSRAGMFNLLGLVALLSVFIGFFNLLPLPALDGGRVVFLIIEAIRGKPVERNKEALVHLIGMAVLLGLILLISIKDIGKIFGG